MNRISRSLQFVLTGLTGALLTMLPVSAEGLSLYGSVTTEAIAGLGEANRGQGGFESDIRIIAETTGNSAITFRAEAGALLSYGLSSEAAIIFDSAAVQPPSQLPPGDDLHREVYVDQAWAETTLELFTVKAGILPVSWGSAYIHNPVARTAPPALPGEDLDRAIGRPGIILFVPLPAGFSTEGYALAAPRLDDAVPHIAELDFSTIPFGTKLQFQSPFADLAIYAIREVMQEGMSEVWIGADGTTVFADITVYAEFATTLSYSTELSVGFSCIIPGIDLGLRGEYIHLSSGAEHGSCSGISFIDGSERMLGQQYVFLQLEKEDPRAAAWKLSAGTLVNLLDRSAAILGEAEWRPLTDFCLGGFTRIFTADESSSREFGGSLPIAPGMALRPYRSVAGIRATWYF
mgnify:FL=1